MLHMDEHQKYYIKKPDTKTTYCFNPLIWNFQERQIYRNSGCLGHEGHSVG